MVVVVEMVVVVVIILDEIPTCGIHLNNYEMYAYTLTKLIIVCHAYTYVPHAFFKYTGCPNSVSKL